MALWESLVLTGMVIMTVLFFIGLYLGGVYIAWCGYSYVAPIWHLPEVSFMPFLISMLLVGWFANLFRSKVEIKK